MVNSEVHSSRRLVGAAEPSNLYREPSIHQRGKTLNPPPPTRAHAQPPVCLFSAFHYRIHPFSPSIHCFHPPTLKFLTNPQEKYESVFAVLLTQSLSLRLFLSHADSALCRTAHSYIKPRSILRFYLLLCESRHGLCLETRKIPSPSFQEFHRVIVCACV